MTEAPWLLPTQNVGGVVELSTNTRRMFVGRGSMYSVNLPVLGSSRSTRSLSIEPVHASPFLSRATSYGCDHGVGAGHSWKRSAFVSNTAILLPRYSANHRRSCASICPRRGAERVVGIV